MTVVLGFSRHFIEAFFWTPLRETEWSLHWFLFEVVRDEWILVTTRGDLTTVSADRPPSVDLHSLAVVRVNSASEAEWAVLSGPSARSEVIEPDAERREVREKTLARREADARVDWNRIGDRRRNPVLRYTDADGCGNVFVYGWSSDRMETMTLQANEDVVRSLASPQSFDLASRPPVELLVHVYEQPQRDQPFCSDVGRPPVAQETWKAIGGVITIERTSNVRARAPYQYRVTIRIDGAEFISPSGARVRQVAPIILTAIAGRISG